MTELKCKSCGGNIVPKSRKIGVCNYCGVEVIFDEVLDILEYQESEEYRRSNGSRLVRAVQSYGSNNPNDPFADSKYNSSKLDLNQFSVIYFSIKLVTPWGRQENDVEIGLQVFDENENLLFNDVSLINMQPDYEDVRKGWILRGADGSRVAAGDYTAVVWVGDSQAKRYKFTVLDGQGYTPNTTSTPATSQVPKKGLFSRLFG